MPSKSAKTRYLSSSEREQGIKYFVRYSSFNGAGFAFMADTTVMLLALHFGATNTQLGYLASAIQISGLILPFMPLIFGGMSVSKVYHVTWMLRGFVCVLYLLTPLVPGSYAISLILGVYTIFCLVRVIGVSLSQAMQHSLTLEGKTGELVAKMSLGFNVSTLVAKIISAVVLKLHLLGEVTGLLVLQVMGIVCNTLAASNIRRIPVRDTIERSPAGGIFTVFIDMMRRREIAQVLVLNWTNLCMGILLGFTVPFLRRVTGMSDSLVVVYSLAATVAAISAALFVKPFADRLGSKPLLIASNALALIVSFAWAFFGHMLSPAACIGLGFAGGLVFAVTGLLTNRLLIRSIPEQDKVSYTAMYSFISAIIALATGYAGGVLADAGASVHVPFMHIYSFPFIAAGLFALFDAVLSTMLRDSGSMSLRETIGILFSTKNLRAFLDIYELETTTDPMKRQSVQISLEHSDTPLATTEIGAWLRNPLPMEKERALRSLFSHPRQELLPDILAEAADPHSCNREQAVFALGAYKGDAVEKILLQCMDDTNPLVKSVAAKSLARVGNTSTLEAITALAHDPAQSPECRLNYLIALLIMDKDAQLLAELFTYADPARGFRFEQAAFSVCANRLGMTPALAGFYHRENMTAAKGFRDLLAETKELPQFLEHHAALLKLYRQGKYAEIWQWCRAQVDGRPVAAPLDKLAGAVKNHVRETDNANTMAVVYFTYQILRR